MRTYSHGGEESATGWSKHVGNPRQVTAEKRNGPQRRREMTPARRSASRGNAIAVRARASELREGEAPRFELSPWAQSRSKRVLDIAAVLLCLPILVPLLGAIALAIFVTSGAPVIFRQKRMGRYGVPFEFYKFRTMRPSPAGVESAIAIASAHRVTRLGSLLRRSKLDELPQLLHVLRGELSLVGPRPKVPEQQMEPLPCRPGLTGPATLAFAREESVLMQVPPDEINSLFNNQFLPAKWRLDMQYMRRATLLSDLRILADTILCRWDLYAGEVQWTLDQESCEEPSGQTASLCP